MKLYVGMISVGLLFGLFLFSMNDTTDGLLASAKSKTITKDYASEEEVLHEVHYPEYVDGKWYSGTLTLTGEVQELSHAWRATYTGNMVTN